MYTCFALEQHRTLWTRRKPHPDVVLPVVAKNSVLNIICSRKSESIGHRAHGLRGRAIKIFEVNTETGQQCVGLGFKVYLKSQLGDQVLLNEFV